MRGLRFRWNSEPLAVVFDRRERAILLDGFDGILSAGLRGVSLRRKHHFVIVLKADAKLSGLILVDFELVHGSTPSVSLVSDSINHDLAKYLGGGMRASSQNEAYRRDINNFPPASIHKHFCGIERSGPAFEGVAERLGQTAGTSAVIRT